MRQYKYYQTFTATGVGVRGISWRMAGFDLYNGKTATVSILQDNGNSNPANWTPVGSGTDGNLAADSDEWVRFRYGQLSLTPGKQYAVGVSIPGGMSIYKRNKDADSYSTGRAYDKTGSPKNFDLNVTVFVDTDESIVTHTRRSSGPGNFNDNFFDQRWGQTFVAQGTSLAAVDMFAASNPGFNIQWQVRDGGPQGALIGPTKTVGSAYFATTTALAAVSYNPGEVPLTPGHTYFIEAVNPSGGFNPFLMEPQFAFPDGNAFRNGVAVAGSDLSMTIMEYLNPAPPPTTVAFTNFDEPASGATNYTRGTEGVELGFVTTYTPTGTPANLAIGQNASGTTPSSPIFSQGTADAATVFETVKLANWDDVTASVMLQIRATTYEDGDYLRVFLTSAADRIDLLSLSGAAALNSRAGDGYLFYTADIPDSWTSATLHIESRSNSSAGSERFDFDNVKFTGYAAAVPEPSSVVLLIIGATAGCLLKRRIPDGKPGAGS
jgi:hypothetical protein